LHCKTRVTSDGRLVCPTR